MEPGKKFQYSSLAPGEIRVVRVYRQSDQPDQLKFNFRVTNLEDKTLKYTAISYVWGDSVRTASAHARDGTTLALTASAHGVLEELMAENPFQYFWIDALCINQDDMTEKNQQVRAMGKIYAKASKVLIWLGRRCEVYQRAFAHVRLLQERTADQIDWSLDGPEFWERSSFTKRKAHQIGSLPDCGFPSQGWDAIYKIFEHSWFYRMWVIQEAVSAIRIFLSKALRAKSTSNGLS